MRLAEECCESVFVMLTALIGHFKSQLLQIIAIDIARLAGEGQISSKTRRRRLDIGGLVARARRELVIVGVVSRQDGGRSQTGEEKTLPELHDARLQSKVMSRIRVKDQRWVRRIVYSIFFSLR